MSVSVFRLVEQHMERLESEAREQDLDLEVVARALLDRAVAIYKRSRTNEDIAAELEFVAGNLEDDEEPKDPSYSPDGGYIPRILFVKNGKVVPEANTGNDQYKYFYSQAADIVKKMESFAAGDFDGAKEEL